MDFRSECIAKAALCVDRMKTDPARREYWINETIRWLERAAKLRDSGDLASRHELNPRRNPGRLAYVHPRHA